VKKFQKDNQPVISVYVKKENVGNYANSVMEWEKKGNPILVNTYDFPDKELGKACPYGVYDIARNEGWVNVGISKDTAEFAVESIRRWWIKMGKCQYHFPPGTSKWNKIEHRLFISKNWRGKPLDSIATIVNLISNTTTEKD